MCRRKGSEHSFLCKIRISYVLKKDAIVIAVTVAVAGEELEHLEGFWLDSHAFPATLSRLL